MDFVDAHDARLAAAREIETGPQRDDPQFTSWQSAVPGEPRMVHDLLGRASYWLVPVQNQKETVGAVRVLGNGRAAASISYRQGSNPLALNPNDVLKQASGSIATERGEKPGEVLLVHDGPIGREAWRVEVLAGDRPTRWVFVSPGGISERAVNVLPDETKE